LILVDLVLGIIVELCSKLLDNRLVITINVNQVEALDEIVPVSQRQNRWSHLKRRLSGFALINQTPQTQDEPEASESCSWWRRGRVELWRSPLQLWMHSVISPGPWPAWQTPLMKPAQIRWNC